jgi:hypothetical protein
MSLLLLQLPIGRGHPNYLNLLKKELNIPYYYFEIPLNLPKIKFLNLIYKNSPKYLFFYNKIRKKGKVPNYLIKGIRKEIEKILPKEEIFIIVSHPLLAKALEDKNIYYLHGEIAFPKEAVCKAKKIFVPLAITKEKAKAYGIKEENIGITNLFVEKELAILKTKAYEERIKRIKDKKRLTGAIFLSGAYPQPHIKKIIKYSKILLENNIRVYLFSFPTYLFYFERKLFPYGINLIKIYNWEDELIKFSQIFLTVDFFIAASHERINWALGLSLPMFVLTPFIGSYAKENYEIARNYNACFLINELKNFLKESLYEKLLTMNESTHNKFSLDGAKNTAFIIEKELSNLNYL